VPDWAVWVIVAAALAAGEVATPGWFVLGLVAPAALGSALAAAVGAGLAVELAVFIAGSIAFLLVLRPAFRRHLRQPPALRTGSAALVGGRALVLARVDEHGGRVKIGGEEWSARAFLDDDVFEPGAHVQVVKIEGATALVHE
jgi:membrane protein implicated in regulation of membrane protease activity